MSNLKTEHEIEIDRIHDRQLAEKDAEIERLKADLDYWHHIATVDQRQLITELCDALELPFEEWTDQSDLLQRARGATR